MKHEAADSTTVKSVVKWKAGKQCLFLMLSQDHLYRTHLKTVEWLTWRCLVTDLLSTRLILNRQKVKQNREQFDDIHLIQFLEIAKQEKEYQKLIKIAQNCCSRKK